jgi:hypothetical protein
VSRRNNLERMGAPLIDAPAPPTKQFSDLFSFVSPTEFVDLPSKGLLYPPDHPLHNVETIEIKHLTAKEEDILTSETLLRKGLAIDRLVESILIDKSIRTDSLLIGDKNAILLAARITGFGPSYEVAIECPGCSTKQDIEFDLTTICAKESDMTGVEHTASQTYKFILPVSKIEIEIRQLTSKDEKTVIQEVESRKKNKLPENNSTMLLNAMIVSANGSSDRSLMLELIDVLPLRDSKFIRATYDRIKPDIDTSQDFVCPACGHDGKVVMPLTAEFFWPQQ